MRIGAHYQQVTVKVLGRCQKPCTNDVLHGCECRSINLEVVRSEVCPQFGREWATSLIVVGPKDTYRLRTVQPWQCRQHCRGRFGRAVPANAYPLADR